MPRFNVHIYREMRLRFDGIEAATPEAAADAARSLSLKVADDFDECDGETFAALVDLEGDEDFSQSVLIDFENEQLRKTAPELLQALDRLTIAASDLDAAIVGVTDQFDDERSELEAACRNAHAALTKAKGGRKEVQP